MLTFESKMSGVRCEGFEHIDTDKLTTEIGAIKISSITKLKTFNFIVEMYNVVQLKDSDDTPYLAIFPDCDDLIKIAIMEDYPEEEQQLKEHFGTNWAKYYIRFGH